MSEQAPNPEQARKAQLNDEFRRSGPNEDWYITQGARALPDVPGLIGAVRTFNTFTPDNDPWGEHDFGSIIWHTERPTGKLITTIKSCYTAKMRCHRSAGGY